MAKTASEVIQW